MPQDIYQTAKVSKILLLLEAGRGKEFHGKSLNEIELEQNIYNSSESDDDETEDNATPFPVLETAMNTSPSADAMLATAFGDTDQIENTEQLEDSILAVNLEQQGKNNEEETELKPIKEKLSGRARWTSTEKNIVLRYFREHIKNKISPKKHECEAFFTLHKQQMKIKDWVKVKTFIYN